METIETFEGWLTSEGLSEDSTGKYVETFEKELNGKTLAEIYANMPNPDDVPKGTPLYGIFSSKRAHYRKYLSYYLYTQEAIPDVISSAHISRMKDFEKALEKASVSIINIIDRMVGIRTNNNFYEKSKAYSSNQSLSWGTTNYLVKRHIILERWDRERKQMVSDVTDYLVTSFGSDKDKYTLFRNGISEAAKDLYKKWKLESQSQELLIPSLLQHLMGMQIPKKAKDIFADVDRRKILEYIAIRLIRLFIVLLKATDDTLPSLEYDIPLQNKTHQKDIWFQTILPFSKIQRINRNITFDVSSMPTELFYSGLVCLEVAPHTGVRLIYALDAHAITSTSNLSSIWNRHAGFRSEMCNLAKFLSLLLERLVTQQKMDNYLISDETKDVIKVVQEMLETAPDILNPKNKKICDVLGDSDRVELLTNLVTTYLGECIRQAVVGTVDIARNNCEKISKTILKFRPIVEKIWGAIPMHAEISDNMPRIEDVQMYLARRLLIEATASATSSSRSGYFDAVEAEYIALQCILSLNKDEEKFPYRSIRIQALVAQAKNNIDITPSRNKWMDYALPAYQELIIIRDLIPETSQCEADPYFNERKKLCELVHNAFPSQIGESVEIFDVDKADLSAINEYLTKAIQRRVAMPKEPSDASDVTYYMDELDSVRLKDSFDFGEVRLMAQLLRGTVVLTLPQLVDTPLRHLVNNKGFAKLLKEGRIAVSLYQNFYSLLEYAATQMERSFCWSSLSDSFNKSQEARNNAALYLRGNTEVYTDIDAAAIAELRNELVLLDSMIPYSHREKNLQYPQDILYADAMEVSYGALEQTAQYSQVHDFHKAIIKALQMEDPYGMKLEKKEITRSKYLEMLACRKLYRGITSDQIRAFGSLYLSDEIEKSLIAIANDTYNRMLSSFVSSHQIFSNTRKNVEMLQYKSNVPTGASGGIEYHFRVTATTAESALQWETLAEHIIGGAEYASITFQEHAGAQWPACTTLSASSGKMYRVEIDFNINDNEVIHIETNGFVKRSPQWKRYLYLMEQYPDCFLSKAPERLYAKLDAEEKAAAALGKEVQLGVLEETENWLLVREWNGSETVERIIYLDKDTETRIAGYFDLVKNHGDLFIQSEQHYPICFDVLEMLRFENDTKKNTDNKKVGLLVNNYPYWQVVADLICPNSKEASVGKEAFIYQRIIPYSGGGSVILPVWKDSEGINKFCLLNNFRHSIRKKVLELPRGHQQEGLSPEENAKKELCEELKISHDQIAGVINLGTVMPDSGLTASEVSLFAAEIIGEAPPTGNIGHEGIKELLWVDIETLEKMIADDRIVDGFTIAAFTRYMLTQRKT